MVHLIIGGSGSGKSTYAETCMQHLSGEKYYIATMQIYDKEGKAKVARHRKMRQGKGYVTIEQPVSVGKISFLKEKKGSALLECVSNLTANEMFSGEQMKDAQEVSEKIVSDIRTLAGRLDNLVIVTNNVFEDGISYDASTREYQKALGSINQKLAELAEQVTEVVVGIPVVIKQKEGM